MFENGRFRDICLSRSLLAGFVFFLLCVGSSFFYNWHVRRTTQDELSQSAVLLQHREPQNETRPVANAVDTSPVDFEQATMPLETDNAQEIVDVTVLPSDDAAPIDLWDAFLPDDFVSEEEIVEHVPVSPYGFGPYPEVPTDYTGNIPWEWDEETLANLKKVMENGLQERGLSWMDCLKAYELMARVGIKLWNEGRRFEGMTTSDQTGLFYPNEPDVLYVKWREAIRPNGDVIRYMSRTIGSATANLSIAVREGREPPPDWLEVRSMDEGIDPYNFLGLPR